jgi:uncharacterized protein with HEPN domain
MAGMRDRMIHNYLGLDYEIVWHAVRNKAPVLRVQLGRMSGWSRCRGRRIPD